MDFIDEDMKLAVKHGSLWMDENFHGWAFRINLDNLKMQSCDDCIIGQAALDMGYWATIETGAQSYYMKDSIEWAITNGFDIPRDGISDDDWYTEDGRGVSEVVYNRYGQLESLWTDEVKKRLG